ncbi:MAG: rod shape-determining protein RodA [Myxococcota bacterium]|jgi:rod shape determining protein RodA|nr:rod shape-determining protein RodA [Myxococcota bacterium]
MTASSSVRQSRLRSFALSFDWVLLGLVLAIASVGILNLYSAAAVLPQPLHTVQIVWLGVGTLFFALPASIIDYRFFERWAYLFFAVVSFLLLLVLLVGKEYNGSRRWIDLGFTHFQPSELMKIAVVIAFARYFSQHEKKGGWGLRDLAGPFGLLLIPMFLIFQEPDLGTTILVLLLGVSVAWFEGIKRSSVIIVVLASIAVAPFAWAGMKPYQKDRIKTFLQIEEDPYGRDWQVKNSVIAVGSGGLTGRGFGQGSQIRKGFVPEPENDFALSNWAEEQGFVGTSLLLLLYLALILWSLRIASHARDRFGTLLSVGLAAIIFWQVIVNVGMVLRWAPVVGITLPLVSYGGSSVVTILICIGLLMNVSVRRHMYRA